MFNLIGNNLAKVIYAIVHCALFILSFVSLLLCTSPSPPLLYTFFFSSTLPFALCILSPLSKSLLYYSLLSSLLSGFVSLLSHIPVLPSLASPGVRIQTLLHSCPPSALSSLLSNLKSCFLPCFSHFLSLSGLFPKLEVNTLQQGVIFFLALWQYKKFWMDSSIPLPSQIWL